MDKIQIKNPGQRYVDNFIIYDALGGPLIDEKKWHLSITGMVKNPKTYTYKELEDMKNIEYISDFLFTCFHEDPLNLSSSST